MKTAREIKQSNGGDVGKNWSVPVSPEEAVRRAGGRRRYNAERRDQVLARRRQVADLLHKYGLIKHGTQARIADELGVSRATVHRDVRAILKLHRLCACCGSLVPRDTDRLKALIWGLKHN